MSIPSKLGSSLSNTKMRDQNNLSDLSGMCSVCTSTCTGTCEIGLSAVRGTEAVYPFSTDQNQFGSNKQYPLDFSHFNINGRVFGANGVPENSESATFVNASIGATFGLTHKVPMKLPIIMPAMAKLDWYDYFAGAAIAGISVVIGEDVIAKDNGLIVKDGKVVKSPLISEMVDAFRKYHHGFGDVILQANADDDEMGVLEYGILTLGVKSVEFKFGQAAKGIQGVGRVKSLNDALKFKDRGNIIFPDPLDPNVIEPFERIGKLPFWDETTIKRRIETLRDLGVERICFKTGPFAPKDLLRIVKIAAENNVDMITVDGAGGGTGNSPIKMMNEWGIPTIELIIVMRKIYDHLSNEFEALPQLAIGGGIVMEDQVFKAMAIGAPHVSFVCIGRGAMAAAMSGKVIGEKINAGHIPKDYEQYGNSVDTVFADYHQVKSLLSGVTDELSVGALGVYSFMNRISYGFKQLMALNRKFDVSLINREDVVTLTHEASKFTGLPTYEELLDLALIE
jgi:hypothetical protein